MTVFRYLLDTNILSELIKNPSGLPSMKIASLDDSDACCTSLIVACELRYGALKKGSDVLKYRVDQLLETITVLPLEGHVIHHYAEIRLMLERKGQIIGNNDLLIAAHARSLGLIVVTANVREFARVPGLKVENWLE